MVSALYTSVLLVAALIMQVAARPEFVSRIPNAGNVAGVTSIGHVSTSGGGARNAFGQDFAANGQKWTADLCKKDSDGDGQTNGQELGDPCCEWTTGADAKLKWTTGVSAPGDATSKTNASLLANVNCTSAAPTPAPSPSGAVSNGVTVLAISVTAAAAATLALA